MPEPAVVAALSICLAVLSLLGSASSITSVAPSQAEDQVSPTAATASISARSRRWVMSLRPGTGSERALLESVGLIVEHLRSGGSVDDGISALRDGSGGDVVGTAFEHLADRLQLGVGFSDAIRSWADEIGTVEARLVASTLVMHRRSGGSLAPILQRVMDALAERLDTEAEIRSLTAQARLSAWIVGSLPFGFLLFLTVISGPSIVATFLTPVGGLVLLIGIALEGAAAIWMRRILDVTR